MTREQYEMQKHIDRQRAFLKAIEPIVQRMVYIESCYVPTLIVYPDGRMEMGDDPSPQRAEMLAQCRAVIEQIAKSFQCGDNS